MTPEEEERVEKRRVQNREAAQRFRERQKNKVHVLQKVNKIFRSNDGCKQEEYTINTAETNDSVITFSITLYKM